MLEKILKLGHPKLYERSVEVNRKELAHLNNDINLLHDLILECQRVHGFGRGIAAPQIGVMKRIVCLNLKGEQYTLINPQLSQMSEKMMELWDDCMSFPGLHVRLQRHRSCRLSFYDCQWEKHFWDIQDDLSELLQHECDHLDGILATQRALDDRSFRWV